MKLFHVLCIHLGYLTILTWISFSSTASTRHYYGNGVPGIKEPFTYYVGSITPNFPKNIGQNCADWRAAGYYNDGVYSVEIKGQRLDVYCDMLTDYGGWLVIQRRVDGSFDFNRTWSEYKHGFGNNLTTFEKNFWLGNDKIHALTAGQDVTLMVELEDCSHRRVYEFYTGFYIEDELGDYKLHICGCAEGQAEDSLTPYWEPTQDVNHMKFTTRDRDNDLYKSGNCAVERNGGWWFNDCGYTSLNGVYHTDCCEDNLHYQGCSDGILWYSLKYYNYSVAYSTLKIRPQVFPSEMMEGCF